MDHIDELRLLVRRLHVVRSLIHDAMERDLDERRGRLARVEAETIATIRVFQRVERARRTQRG